MLNTGQTAAITVNTGQMVENSGNMTRRLTDAIGRAIAETLNAAQSLNLYVNLGLN